MRILTPFLALVVALTAACSSGEPAAKESASLTTTVERTTTTTADDDDRDDDPDERTTTTTRRDDVDAEVAFPPVIGAIGDSLLAGAEQALRDDLGERDLVAHGVVGLRTEDADTGLGEVLEAEPAGLVVVLGTNNILDGDLVEADLDAVRGMAVAVAERPCVWWVDLTVSTADTGFNERARQLNAEIEAQAARIGSLDVIRWSQAVAQHPDWVGLDSVHLTTAGNEAIAAMITDALRTCSGTVIPQ